MVLFCSIQCRFARFVGFTPYEGVTVVAVAVAEVPRNGWFVHPARFNPPCMVHASFVFACMRFLWELFVRRKLVGGTDW